jgi:hypothetical protein
MGAHCLHVPASAEAWGRQLSLVEVVDQIRDTTTFACGRGENLITLHRKRIRPSRTEESEIGRVSRLVSAPTSRRKNP